MLIVGLNKTTLLDYPGCVAAAVFVGGCNFKCPFCHNAGIVLEPLVQGTYTETEILSFLEKRKGVLKGVCITGGEPTLHADLPDFVKKLKELGYRVKLDTNGYAPKVLECLLKEKLLDYVAMDIKNCPEKYALTVGMDSGQFSMERVKESAAILKESEIDYEFRTTMVKELHTKEDMLKIADWIKGCPHYFLQQYQYNENVIDFVLWEGMKQKETGSGAAYEGFQSYGRAEMEELAEAIRRVPGMTGEVSIRGAE